MTDTLWSDISSFQVPVTDAYPHACLCIRSNDGTFLDTDFNANYTWCKRARTGGKLFTFGVYYLYRPGANGAHILMDRVGKPDPRMWVMIDMESVGGQVHGDQSAQVNSEHAALAKWLGDPRRVVGYGNVGDLDALWPAKPHGMRVVVAAYGSNPSYPGKFAHQFTDKANTAPFGPSDLNSADGMAPGDLLAMFGFASGSPPPPPPQMPGTRKGPFTLHKAQGWEADGSLSLDAVMARRNSRAILSVALTFENASPESVQAMNAYISGGTGHPMPAGLVFCTASP